VSALVVRLVLGSYLRLVVLSHPLFASAAARHPDAPPDVGFIQVRRRVGDRWERLPGTFAASELLSAEALEKLFGGGAYELIGRCPRNRRIAARVRLEIEGSPKPPSNTDSVPADGAESAMEADAPNRRKQARQRVATDGRLRALRERGKVQARAFRMFENGESDGRIARRIGLPIEEIRRLRREYERPPGSPELRELEHGFALAQRATERTVCDRRARERDQRTHELELQRLKLAERVVALRERELQLAERLAERGESFAKPERRPAPAEEFRALEQVLDVLVRKVGRR
jgi:hypothetical protein